MNILVAPGKLLAARMLAAPGRRVVNPSGGMHAWVRAGRPLSAETGTGRIL